MTFAPPSQMRTYWVTSDGTGGTRRKLTEQPFEGLPPGEVLVRVAFSSLNFKDGLAATGHPAVVKKFPHIPGIDASGTVILDSTSTFRPGDEVLVTGYDLGVGQWGGFCEYVRVPAAWLLPLPTGMSLREAMAYGTAGFTAGLCVQALVKHEVTPDRGEVVVSGASGGVSSIAIGILAKLGYQVAAVSGKSSSHDLLKRLGAAEVIERQEVDQPANKPLLNTRWSGAIDVVGGTTLGTILRSIARGGCVAACGLVGGIELPITVYPFILRGVTLCGIDSVWASREERELLWPKLAHEWKPALLDELIHEVTLDELDASVDAILAGKITGRAIVKIAD